MEYDVIVIGSGPAGEKGAAQAAYFGKKSLSLRRKRLTVALLQIQERSLPRLFVKRHCSSVVFGSANYTA